MSQVSTNELKPGIKIELSGEPHTLVHVEFVKPGKGQAFTRTKLKHLITKKIVEKTFKSGEKFDLADVEETQMRYLYKEGDGYAFMHDQTYDQISVPQTSIESQAPFMLEDTVYDLVFYKGEVVDVIPPIFLNMKIVETSPGVRGDTASGRVLKPAQTETGATVHIPIFIEEGEWVKIDTRTGAYVSRVKE